ncbi:MAG: hypothetical protein R3C02_19005 [Planctomycetaceae bacterium]
MRLIVTNNGSTRLCGKIRKDLRRYVNHGEMLGRKGRTAVSIPVPNIDIPHFRHGKRGSGGTGQGRRSRSAD